MKITKKQWLWLVLLIFFTGLAWLAGRASALPTNTNSLITELRLNLGAGGGYRFVNPLLGCQTNVRSNITELLPLENKIRDVMSREQASGNAKNISVYFDTRDGNWLGINTEDRYSPASLLKVPNLLAIYKASENDPELLNRKMVFTGNPAGGAEEFFQSTNTLKKYRSYTVQELVERMIVDSDNDTLPLLDQVLDFSQYKEVYTDVGLSLPEGPYNGAVDFMTAKSYANFFRVLYNATYLNQENSERALELLSRTTFDKGLRAGVPAPIPVAHKFGERSFTNDLSRADQKELHDCGIVYYPGHPYLLCVMTRGVNFDRLADVLKHISQTVYDFTNTQYAGPKK